MTNCEFCAVAEAVAGAAFCTEECHEAHVRLSTELPDLTTATADSYVARDAHLTIDAYGDAIMAAGLPSTAAACLLEGAASKGTVADAWLAAAAAWHRCVMNVDAERCARRALQLAAPGSITAAQAMLMVARVAPTASDALRLVQRAAECNALNDVCADTLRELRWRRCPSVCGVGGGLAVTADVAAGATVLNEKPLMRWRPVPEVRSDATRIDTACVSAFELLDTAARHLVLQLPCPEVPSGTAVALHRNARRIGSTTTSVADLCALSLIARSRCVDLDGDVALFDSLSTAAVSCAPTVRIEQGRTVALHDLPRGGRVLLPTGDHTLLMGTDVRRSFLGVTHLAWCSCDRCEAPMDECRGIACTAPKCGGTRFRYDQPPAVAVPEELWRCDACGDTWPDDAMPLAAEERAEAKANGLWQQRGALRKNYFKDVQDALLECGGILGRRHWVHVLLLQCLADYFVALAAASRDAGDAHAILRFAAVWGHKRLLAACDMGLHHAAPHVLADAAVALAAACADAPALRVSNVALLHAALCWHAPTVDAADLEILRSTTLLPSAGAASPVSMAAVHALIDDTTDFFRDAVGEDDAAVLAEWEGYLVQRVASQNRRQLPATVAAALQQQ
jgi:hypothetical protein